MSFLFILIFACSTYSNPLYLTTGSLIDNSMVHLEHPTCLSDILILKTEAEILDLYRHPRWKGSFNILREYKPDKILKLDLKTGIAVEVKVEPILEFRKKMVEQEEKIIKGWEIK